MTNQMINLVSEHQPTPEPQYAGIMFADIRGYKNLEGGDNHEFHKNLFPALWNNLIEQTSPDLEYCNLWGDGIMCIGRDLAKLAEFSLKLAEAFEQNEWNTQFPLRLRISLDSGNIGLSGRSNNNQIEQYLSTSMVKPARLEPVVRPGQVWCTENFYTRLQNRNELGFIIDKFNNSLLPQRYNPGTLVARLRFRRNNEEDLKKLEQKIRDAQIQSNGSQFCQAVRSLLEASEGEFVYLSKYLSWYEIFIEMIDRFQKYQESLDILEKFKNYVDKKKWMSPENIVYFTCFFAKCRSHLSETTAQDLQQILGELQELYQSENSPEELLMLIAKTYKEVVIILCQKENFSKRETKKHLIHCHDEMFSKIFNQEQSVPPRFFPELASLLTYQKINYRAALCMIETALFVQCLTRDQQIKTKFTERKDLLAQWLITDFRARNSHNHLEIFTVSLAYILLGNKEMSEQALSGHNLPDVLQHELKERLEIIADFPRMDNNVSEVALHILDRYF